MSDDRSSNPLRAEHYATDREWAIALTAEIECLQRELESVTAGYKAREGSIDNLATERVRLRAALRWYSDEHNWTDGAAWEDKGGRARVALSGEPT